MPLAAFELGVSGLDPLVSVVRLGSASPLKLTSAGIDLGIIETASGSTIVLLVARFEQFLKDIGLKALDRFALATPPVRRTDLDTKIQLTILSRNVNAALQKSRHGTARAETQRLADLQSVASNILKDEIWGGHAIETHSNPGTETVRELLSLLSISNPWVKLEEKFRGGWSATRLANPKLKAIPSAAAELTNIIGWRNIVAHTNSIPAGLRATELDDSQAFLLDLARAIDSVVSSHVARSIRGLKSRPATW